MTVQFEKYNKIVRFMAKNFDEVADKFSKKDNTCYVVCRKNIVNGEPVVVAYYKTAKGAQGYINRIIFKEDFWVESICEGDVKRALELSKPSKSPIYKVGDVVEGYVACGVKNPFYNEKVQLVIKHVGKNYRGEIIYTVKTVEKRKFEHHIDFIKRGKVVRTEKKYVMEQYEGWLELDKGVRKIFSVK